MNETEYKAGAVAELTLKPPVPGEEPTKKVVALYTIDSRHEAGWRDTTDEWYESREIHSVRPLTVLDLSDPKRAAYVLRQTASRAAGHMSPDLVKAIADQIEDQTKPLRIPEPGLYAVVEAGSFRHNIERTSWFHDGKGLDLAFGAGWDWVDGRGNRAIWSALIAPELIRPGIEPTE